MAPKATARADLIYRNLRADILSGRLCPGHRLPFAELCRRYDVSIGVLREVLPRLSEQGLVSAEPQIGFRVMSVSEEDLVHLTEARVHIETLVLRQSIEGGDLSWESAVLAAPPRGEPMSAWPDLTLSRARGVRRRVGGGSLDALGRPEPSRPERVESAAYRRTP